MAAEPRLLGEHLDVYDTRAGLWNPDVGDMEMPEGWELLPAGDAFLTRTVKAAGLWWQLWKPRSRGRGHRRLIGILAPKTAIEAAKAAAEETAATRAKSRAHGAASRTRAEDRYRQELESAITSFLAFDDVHAGLAAEIAAEAAARAAVVGSGRVGRTRTLGLEERAELAARAYVRHRHTSYEDDLIGSEVWDDEVLYRHVKRSAQAAVDAFLERHRPTGSAS